MPASSIRDRPYQRTSINTKNTNNKAKRLSQICTASVQQTPKASATTFGNERFGLPLACITPLPLPYTANMIAPNRGVHTGKDGTIKSTKSRRGEGCCGARANRCPSTVPAGARQMLAFSLGQPLPSPSSPGASTQRAASDFGTKASPGRRLRPKDVEAYRQADRRLTGGSGRERSGKLRGAWGEGAESS